MSKKSRRRNRRLALLGALGAGLMLAGRGKGTAAADVNSGRGGDSSSAKARKIANAVTTGKTIQDNMPKGIDKKIEDVVVPKNITNPNLNLGRMTGQGPDSGLAGQEIRANYARKMRNIASDRNRNDMLRAIRSTQDIATTPDSILQGVPLEDSMISAKKGGRIVKGEKVAKLKKKKGIQIRGFGKARRG
tara:strand:- start:200 stop:769 length:570 start_codon:yes stop_codon:yes gene_type:complete